MQIRIPRVITVAVLQAFLTALHSARSLLGEAQQLGQALAGLRHHLNAHWATVANASALQQPASRPEQSGTAARRSGQCHHGFKNSQLDVCNASVWQRQSRCIRRAQHKTQQRPARTIATQFVFGNHCDRSSDASNIETRVG